MAPGGKPPEDPRVPAEVSRRAIRLGSEVGFSTLFLILGAVFGGLWLDGLLGTRPLLTLILVLGTVPVSLYLTYRMARKAVKDFEASRKTANQRQINHEGDETGE